ncbi:hypothetical protein QCA50_007316 [Cerrena zonata]|uniref:Uncharacterized protein n=1 Tax=Cerrena zonata TaxID=2478898 RepID=A0AAW0GDS8_9APHY
MRHRDLAEASTRKSSKPLVSLLQLSLHLLQLASSSGTTFGRLTFGFGDLPWFP